MITALLLAVVLPASAASPDACAGGTIESRAKAGCVPALTPGPGLNPAAAAPSQAQEYKVYDKAGALVLVFKDRSGPLVSAAMPSEGSPVTHPFVSGSAHDPSSENALRELLEASKSVKEFVARLKREGYRVDRSGPPPATAAKVAPGSAWEVLRSGRPVLRVVNTPGPLTGTALPPPGVEPPGHPFLSGSALVVAEEGRLREILDASRSTADFFERLRRAGYEVRPAR